MTTFSATTISASEFKAKCLSLMERVRQTGEIISITKRGQEVARLVPGPDPQRRRRILRQLRGSVQIRGDLIRPALSEKETMTSLRKEGRKIRGSSH